LTISQTGLRSTNGSTVLRLTQAKAPQGTSNSFTEKLTEAFSNSHALTSAKQTGTALPAAAAATRQETVTSGRNLAAVIRHTPAAAVASPFSNSNASSASATPVDGLLGSTKPNDDSTSTPPGAPATTPQTPDQIVAGLLEQNAPPPAYAPVGAASTDPAVYRTDGYIKALNLNSFLQVANHDNQYRYDQYSNSLHEWKEHGMQGDPPAPPKYESVDLNGFNNWWAQYSANPGQDAPPTTFMVNGNTNGTYAWTSA